MGQTVGKLSVSSWTSFVCPHLNRTQALSLIPRESVKQGSQSRSTTIPGVDFPFFSTIVLFKNQLFLWGSDGFLERSGSLERMEMEVSPRTTVDGRNPAPPNKPWHDDSPVNTNQQRFQPWFPRGAGFCPSTVCSFLGMPGMVETLQRCALVRASCQSSLEGQAVPKVKHRLTGLPVF